VRGGHRHRRTGRRDVRRRPHRRGPAGRRGLSDGRDHRRGGGRMSDAESAIEIEVPSDPLAGHAASAYFWGHVAGSGDISDDSIEVVTNDEASAEVLAAIAGGDLEHETTTRDYAHDTSITRTEDEYTRSRSAVRGEGGRHQRLRPARAQRRARPPRRWPVGTTASARSRATIGNCFGTPRGLWHHLLQVLERYRRHLVRPR